MQGLMYANHNGMDPYVDRTSCITPLFNGFHIGDLENTSSCYYNNPPPAHGGSTNIHNHTLSNTQPLSHTPQYNGCGLDIMDIKMEPDTLMDTEFSPQSLHGYNNDSPGSGGGGLPGGRRKNKEDKVCGVCGDRALGYNFDAISCESCKAFFRRNAPKGLEYFKCPYDEKCKMDVSNRRFCKRCRLKKCFEIGMRKEYILTDDEKARKRQKIEENRTTTTKKDTRMVRDFERQGIVNKSPEVSSQTLALSPEDSAEIDELLRAYQSSLEITMDKGTPDSSRSAAGNVQELVNIAELSVRRVIDMSKKIKSFKMLPQMDQIQLLKGGSIELLILRSVITFDKEKQHFLDPTDKDQQAVNIMEMKNAERGTGLFEDHMKFIKTLAIDLRADQTTMILLLVLSLFSPDRGNLIDKDLVYMEQEKYSLLLERYLESQYPYHVAHTLFPKLLMKLTDIRNLNEEHSQVLLKVNPEGIQPLMQEVLDLNKNPGSS